MSSWPRSNPRTDGDWGEHRYWSLRAESSTRARHLARGDALPLATIYDLKPRFQALLRPLSDALARAGLSANEVTLGALLLSAAHGAWLALMPGSAWPLLLLPVTLFLRMAFNAIDGMMAKEHGEPRRRGAERALRRDRRRRALSSLRADPRPQRDARRAGGGGGNHRRDGRRARASHQGTAPL